MKKYRVIEKTAPDPNVVLAQYGYQRKEFYPQYWDNEKWNYFSVGNEGLVQMRLSYSLALEFIIKYESESSKEETAIVHQVELDKI